MVGNAFAGFGFPAEGTVSYIFPSDMFLEGSDLTPLVEHMEELLSGLTSWEPSMGDTGVIEPEMVEVEAPDYMEAYEKVNSLYLRNQWGDGLPIVPPTTEKVDWILTGTNLDPDEAISPLGGVPPRGGIATVRAIAVCLCMAGGRPEYLPVTIACVRAITDPAAEMQSWTTTTNSTIPAIVVNGPIARQIRLSSGYGCLGPDPLYPAGQVIGRAIRILQMTLGGAQPGTSTMSIFGGLRATNCVFAEDEDDLPDGWTTWAEERGYTRDQNIVTMTCICSYDNFFWHFGDSASNDRALLLTAGVMAAPNEVRYIFYNRLLDDGTDLDSGLVLLPKAFVASLANLNGYTKDDVKRFLFDHATQKKSFFKNLGWEEVMNNWPTFAAADDDDDIAICNTFDQIHIAITGGDQGGHGYYMMGVPMGKCVSAEIDGVPENWDDLLFQAEIDLGVPKSIDDGIEDATSSEADVDGSSTGSSGASD